MKVGGKRRVIIPPNMGFGDQAYALKGTRHAREKEGVVPANSTLEYELDLVRVSIPPS
jgi:FKBP-type peptidyl-prolyl cis-trans isomerase